MPLIEMFSMKSDLVFFILIDNDCQNIYPRPTKNVVAFQILFILDL